MFSSLQNGGKNTIVGGFITYRVIAVVAISSIILILALWIGFSEVEKRLVRQTTEELQSRLKSSNEVIHRIWLDGLLEDLEIWAKDSVLVSHTTNLMSQLHDQQVHQALIEHASQKIYGGFC